MVMERRLVPMDDPEIAHARERFVKEFGAQKLEPPKDWDAFEDTYFELKRAISYKDEPGAKANSLSDLAMLVWTAWGEKYARAPYLFVTENKSILCAREHLLASYKIEPLAPAEVEARLAEKGYPAAAPVAPDAPLPEERPLAPGESIRTLEDGTEILARNVKTSSGRKAVSYQVRKLPSAPADPPRNRTPKSNCKLCHGKGYLVAAAQAGKLSKDSPTTRIPCSCLKDRS